RRPRRPRTSSTRSAARRPRASATRTRTSRKLKISSSAPSGRLPAPTIPPSTAKRTPGQRDGCSEAPWRWLQRATGLLCVGVDGEANASRRRLHRGRVASCLHVSQASGTW
ncbi:hypothetical protein T484DRAFT_1914020, partial [Baffinella frigidus]